MRRIAPIALSTLVLLAPATTAGASGSYKKVYPECPRAHSHMMIANAQVEVYTAPEEPEFPEFQGVYGCSYKQGRSYFLGSVPAAVGTPSGGGGVRREVLAGPFVAYEEGSGGPDGAVWTVIVRDLRSGKIIHSVPTGTPKNPESLHPKNDMHYVGIGPTTAIVVKSDGAVAWIVQATEEEGGYQVHALDKTGSRVVASGPEIEPHSLALAGSTLYWTQGSKPMSSLLN